MSSTRRRGPRESGAAGADIGAATGASTADALAVMGGAATGPRRAIVAALLGGDRLQTPDQLLAKARAVSPSTSLATVYRTLERLEAAGRLKRATLASGAVGYAYCAGDHHDHAICTRCGRVVQVEACPSTAWEEPTGFRVAWHDLNFYGTCRSCGAVPAHEAATPA